MVAAQTRDGFEQQIQRFSYASSDGKRDTAARAAFFLKGKILGSYLLTMAYDSDKDLKDRVFRDINPDEFPLSMFYTSLKQKLAPVIARPSAGTAPVAVAA